MWPKTPVQAQSRLPPFSSVSLHLLHLSTFQAILKFLKARGTVSRECYACKKLCQGKKFCISSCYKACDFILQVSKIEVLCKWAALLIMAPLTTTFLRLTVKRAEVAHSKAFFKIYIFFIDKRLWGNLSNIYKRVKFKRIDGIQGQQWWWWPYSMILSEFPHKIVEQLK